MSHGPGPGGRRFTTIDAHTAGEPLRVITGGYPELEGDTILARRQFALENHDDIRRALMLEPRGHADMYGCVLTPAVTPDGDTGVLFLHNEGYSTMCGHGIIGLVKVSLDCGLLVKDGDDPVVRIDTPAGRVTATAHRVAGRVDQVSFLNVPSFLLERDLQVEVEGLGRVRCDVAYGGAFYAYVDAREVGLDVDPRQITDLIEVGMRIKRAVTESYAIVHPDGDPDLEFLYGTVLHQPGRAGVHSRNVCIFADGEVDRSPTGTGVSGRAAILHRRGELELGQRIRIESVIGTAFDLRAVRAVDVAGRPGIIPEVAGRAYITGRHEFYVDPGDPLAAGVLLR